MMELLLTVMQTNFGRKKQNVERIVRINAGETNNNMQIPAKLHMYKATRIQIQKKGTNKRERECWESTSKMMYQFVSMMSHLIKFD